MRVIRVERFGSPAVLVPSQAPEPMAGAGEVVVEVAVAAIDFVQTQLRQGFTPGPPLPRPPYVPGGSVAGQVRSVGAEVDPGWLGRRVVTRTASGYGGNAERAVATVTALLPVPPELGLPEAAALLDDGRTALGLIDLTEPRPGEWVLVEAAGGGLGSLLVQLARAAGARVVGAARGAHKLELARRLGAEAVVDYSEPDWTERVRVATGGRGPDLVFDGVGGQLGEQAFGIVAPGGRFCLHGGASGALTTVDPTRAGRHGVRVLDIDSLRGLDTRALAERALAEAAAGRLRPTIGQTFPLERAAAAHTAIEARAVLGKTLLVL
jgi:NADPH2:quinone reductase